jgi:amino acid adenylation domain-containing protein
MLKLNCRSISGDVAEARERSAHSVALSQGAEKLTYVELDRRADQFSGYLASLGVVAGDTVAICLERSFDWIVAALGIMRAGAAYVPLDLAWPDARLRFALTGSQAKVLVARASLLDRLQFQARGVDPRLDAAKIAASPRTATQPIQPESLAYVIYTSGSTGSPKGVEITHANLLHLIDWHRKAFGVTREDRASHLAGLGFDAAAWEIWPYLSAGATVCLADDAVRATPELIQQWMIREKVTIGFVPTVHIPALMAMPWPTTTALRFLLTGGDALHSFPPTTPSFKVVNNYGPTECTVLATSSVLKAGSQGEPPIGRAITGARVYLLDEEGKEVPDGSIGEIYIGGNGVGRGYRNRPDLTAQSFLQDPFAAELGARMYRTGDRGVRAADGEIYFRGRLDRQTKIRGQRVELDEIGSVLEHHPSVHFATAVCRMQSAANELVGYILPKSGMRIPTSSELQDHLLRSLPDYMIPTIFVRLRELPLSPNGKLDLRLLPQPTRANLLERNAQRSVDSPIAGKLLAIARQVLGNQEVGPEDSFFLAGGHSLLGMQLLIRLRDEFGVDLTLRQLFEAPTVERLAAVVESMLDGSTHSNNPRGNNIVWVQSRVTDLTMVLGQDQPLVSVALTDEDFTFLGKNPTMSSIAACLVCKIREAQAKGPYYIGGFCLGGILAYEVASQLKRAGEDVPLLVLLNAPNPASLDSCDTLARKIDLVQYIVRRAIKLGPRKTYVYAADRLRKNVSRRIGTKKKSPHQLTEIAAHMYQPPNYDGNVLLLMAAQRPPHVNLANSWRALVTGDFHTRYVDAHQRELLKGENVRLIGDAILRHLPIPAPINGSSCCCVVAPRDRGAQTALSAGYEPLISPGGTT